MNRTSKIIVLFLAALLAVGGVMIYAKTIVSPPRELKQVDQYSKDISKCLSAFSSTSSANQEDSLFASISNRIRVFQKEKKLQDKEADQGLDRLVGRYAPLFMDRTFRKFEKSVWNESEHSYMLNVVGSIKQIKHADGQPAIAKSTRDSLNEIERIITDYRKAKALSHHTSFNGLADAQRTINQAKAYASDPWLSICTSLVSSLNNVRSSIGQSHFRHISAIVDKLSQYRYVSEDFYNNTLVPQVDAAITEYEKNASSLYGSKQNTGPLWDRAKRYYDSASDYYSY